eukprot:scaffold149643_cov40-Tisochrysis_lutea.AAC.1
MMISRARLAVVAPAFPHSSSATQRMLCTSKDSRRSARSLPGTRTKILQDYAVHLEQSVVPSLLEQVQKRRWAIKQAKRNAKEEDRWACLPESIRPYAEDIALYIRQTWLKTYPQGASIRKLQRDIAFRMPIITSEAERQTDQGVTRRPPKLERHALEKLVCLLEEREQNLIVVRKNINYTAPDGTQLSHTKIQVRPSSADHLAPQGTQARTITSAK